MAETMYDKNGYIVVLLDESSATQLKKYAVHETVHCHHVTLAYQPTPEVWEKYAPFLEKRVALSVKAMAQDEKGQAVLLKDIPCEFAHPHVTISTKKGVKPFYSNELLEKAEKNDSLKPLNIELTGKITFIKF